MKREEIMQAQEEKKPQLFAGFVFSEPVFFLAFASTFYFTNFITKMFSSLKLYDLQKSTFFSRTKG